jgi:hypothetical protein
MAWAAPFGLSSYNVFDLNIQVESTTGATGITGKSKARADCNCMYGKADWISTAALATARGTDPYCHLSMPYIDLQSVLKTPWFPVAPVVCNS